jgi:hypothetical protein
MINSFHCDEKTLFFDIVILMSDNTHSLTTKISCYDMKGHKISKYPHAVNSHRYAYELKPTEKGDIFLTYTYTRKAMLSRMEMNTL